jgi:hypothetical protein
MSLQTWEEAKLLLTDPNLGNYYFQLKKGARDRRIQNIKLKERVPTISTEELLHMYHSVKNNYSFYARNSIYGDRFYQYASLKNLDPWHKEFRVAPVEEEIAIIKAELDTRPHIPTKLNRKQQRQQRAKSNRNYGRGKSR